MDSLLSPVKLCQPCKRLIVPELDAHGNQPYGPKRKSYRDQQTLKRSVDYGCFVCSRLWERLDPSDEETAHNYKDSSLSRDKPEDEWSRSAVMFRLSERGRLSDPGNTVGVDILVNPSVFRGLRKRRDGISFTLEPPCDTNCSVISVICC